VSRPPGNDDKSPLPTTDATLPVDDDDDKAARPRAAKTLAFISDARERGKRDRAAREAARAAEAPIVDAARKGDPQAFQKLVVAHQGRLFAVAYGILKDRDEAMDAVQDAFIRAHRKLPDFEGNAAFSTWLYRIVVNLCIDKKRGDARRRKVDLDDAMATVDGESLFGDADLAPRMTGSNPLKNAGSKQLGVELQKAIEQLSDDHRAVLLLREIEMMSYEEISETLHIPKGTVMSRLFHARKNLQRTLRPWLGLHDDTDLQGNPVEHEVNSNRGRKKQPKPEATVGGSSDLEEDQADADEQERGAARRSEPAR
jgi:RNA polymerase sigma-70 factor (ECF subfamily)